MRTSRVDLIMLVLVAIGTVTGCEHQRVTSRSHGETTLTAVETEKAPLPTPPVLPGTPDVATLVATVKPGVVNITATQEIRLQRDQTALDPFEFFFGFRPHGGTGQGDEILKRRGLGSGFILDPQGHVVTNAHVVDDATTVRVTLSDGREFDAVVRGRDTRLDLAVLEIQDKNAKGELPHVSLGSSDALRVGEYVVAIGNPFGLGDTVTMGIVSAKSRAIGAGPYDDFIQTDASINPGNSGGPLFNLKGQVVGINTAMSATGRGIGFAIPIDALKDVLPQLLANGKVARGRLGVEIQAMDETLAKALGRDRATGALIGDIESGGPAEKAGLNAGDVIESIDGTPVEHARDLPRLIARHPPGTHVRLGVSPRGKPRRDVDVTLDELREQTPGVASHPARPVAPSKHDFGLDIGEDARGGVVIRNIDPSSNAADVLEQGDAIVEVNGAIVKSARDAADRIKATPQGRPVLLKVRRDDTSRYVALERR